MQALILVAGMGKRLKELTRSNTEQLPTICNNGNSFVAAQYFTVKENIFNRDNWKYLGYY